MFLDVNAGGLHVHIVQIIKENGQDLNSKRTGYRLSTKDDGTTVKHSFVLIIFDATSVTQII